MRSNNRGTLPIRPPFAQARGWPEGAQRSSGPFGGKNNQGYFQNPLMRSYRPQEARSSQSLTRRPSFPQQIRYSPTKTGNATSQIGWNSPAQNLSIRGFR